MKSPWQEVITRLQVHKVIWQMVEEILQIKWYFEDICFTWVLIDTSKKLMGAVYLIWLSSSLYSGLPHLFEGVVAWRWYPVMCQRGFVKGLKYSVFDGSNVSWMANGWVIKCHSKSERKSSDLECFWTKLAAILSKLIQNWTSKNIRYSNGFWIGMAGRAFI